LSSSSNEPYFRGVMAFTARTKIVKDKGEQPTDFEKTVAQHLFELQTHAATNDLKAELKTLYICAAKEVTIGDGKTAVVIFIPYRFLRDFRRIQTSLVNELEKKFSGKHVVLIGQRRILPKTPKSKKAKQFMTKQQKRPRSRTLTAVQDAILEDVVYPAEIIDRRIRVRLDGSKLQKVTLDPKEEQTLEHKLSTFSAVYKRLTGKEVNFMFPQVVKGAEN